MPDTVNYLILRSTDRLNQNSEPNKCEFVLRKPMRNVVKVSLETLIFNRTHYNISEKIGNNKVVYDDGGGSNTFTIPDGTYSFSQLATVITDDIFTQTASEVGMTQSINYQTVFDTDAGFSFDFTGSNTAHFELGFDKAIYSESGGLITSPHPYALNYYNELYVSFSNLQDIVRSSSQSSDDYATFTIFFAQNQGNLITHYGSQLEKQEIDVEHKTFGDFSVTFKHRNDIPLENMSNWIMKLKVTYKDISL